MIRRLFFLVACCSILGVAHSRAQAPVANFSASITSGCGPLGVGFRDQSTNSPQFWQWDFGNGQTSSAQNPSVTYTAPGTYTVTLIVRNASGSDAMRKTDYITVLPFPSPNFITSLTTACAPSAIQFTDQSTPGQGSITSWNWDLGDGTTSNQQSPSHNYAQPGFYTVSLKVTNSGGCSNTLSRNRYIRIVEGIKPNFTWDQVSTSCSAPFIVNYLNQTSGPGTLTYNWDLGNGSTSTALSPSNVSYPSNTAYTVKLSVQSDLGCSASFEKTVTFAGGNAVITAPDAACINAPVTFTNGSTPTPVSNTWDFGDGTNSTLANPSKTFTAAGTYTVTLNNKYTSCANSITKTIQIVDKPVPDFTSDVTSACKPNLTVNFKDNTTPAVTQWLWDFGDGQTSPLQNPAHTYTTAGTFNVKLTVTNATGCTNTITKTAYIKIQPPTIVLNNLQGCANEGVTPGANITTLDGVATYAWTTSGTPPSSNSPTPVFTYPAQGVYPISLTITTTGGCTATANGNVTIGNPTIPTFTATPNPVCGTGEVTFTTTSAPADTWNWNFGDGQTSNAQDPKHSYNSFGTFNVTLALSNSGCVKSVTNPIVVSPPIPNFDFDITCDYPATGNNRTVTFIDKSLVGGGPTTYLWNFGDPVPTTSTTQNPSFTFPADGHYNVQLTVTDVTSGCVQSISKQVVVGHIDGTITFSPNPVCKDTRFDATFTPAASPSDLPIAGYSWQMGPDSGFVNGDSKYTAVNGLPKVGMTPIAVFITDANQCTYQKIANINVIGPTAKFTALGNCKGKPVVFTDNSTPDPNAPGGTITAWTWDFGDGSPVSHVQNPTHPYTDTLFYYVKLSVTDNTTCTNTVTDTIQVTSPTAFFSADTLYCPNVAMPFKDSSRGYNLTYSWNFGDGNTSNLQNPTNTYTTNGQYDISLTVTDRVGCQNTLTKPKYVHIQPPIPAFTLLDSTSICPPLEANFTAQGQYYDSLYWDFGDGSTSTLPVTSHFYNDYGPIDYKPGYPGYYNAQLVLRGPGGCLASATRKVYVYNPIYAYYFYGPPTKACDSVPVTFTMSPPPYIRFILTFGDGTADSSGNLSPFHMYRNPGTYDTQEIMVDPTGCVVGIGGANGDITVLGATPFFDMDKKKFCDNGIVNFTDYTITNDGVASETWNFGDGTTATQPSQYFNTAHPYSTPGTFIPTLQVVTSSGCTESYKDTVKVYQTPHPLISTTGSLCTGLIQFEGNLVTPDIDTVAWSWSFSNGKTSNVQNPSLTLLPGLVTAHLKTSVSFGCNDTISKNVTIFPLPDIKGPKEITTPVGFPVTLPFTYSPNVSTWVWAPVTNLDCPTCANPSATPVFSTEYRVTVTDENGCVNTDSILVKTLCNEKNYFLPNTFSPNGDGVNDKFYPRGSNLYNIQSIRIFNRWGQVVFERKNFPANSDSDGWDGTVNGRPAPPDVYLYIVEVICDNAQVVALHGDVTLIR